MKIDCSGLEELADAFALIQRMVSEKEMGPSSGRAELRKVLKEFVTDHPECRQRAEQIMAPIDSAFRQQQEQQLKRRAS